MKNWLDTFGLKVFVVLQEKLKVRMSKTDEGYVLVSLFTDDVETTTTPEKETKEVESKVDDAVKEETPSKEV